MAQLVGCIIELYEYMQPSAYTAVSVAAEGGHIEVVEKLERARARI
jgi:hypothetical protein